MSLPKPTVGRIVHYKTGRGGRCDAALVVDVRPEGLHLVVWGYSGYQFPKLFMPEVDPAYPEGAPDAEGWHWPEREP